MMPRDWENMKTIEFEDFKRASVTHDLDNCKRCFNIAGRRHEWVGFGIIDVGEAQENDIVVVENGKVPEPPKKKRRRKK